ncbi:hypothetical protein FQR65_LT00999 [Abscondita terminalis]|nr:hypothetical protein FQR65_LT00999 [Abscondita terminalis]
MADLDLYYITAVGSLHSRDHLLKREPSHIQLNLEEAIQNKFGITKDYGTLIASTCNRTAEDIRGTNQVIEESKATTSSSDNELELDLFNDDLMCIICNGMDVAARNRLLECSCCHCLFHQECHFPPVDSADADADGTWTCHTCKEASKILKKIIPGSCSSHHPVPLNTSTKVATKPAVKNSPPHSHKQAVVVPKVHFNITKPGSKAPSVSIAKNVLTANILNADKRIQIMKKKAAKLLEKRKQLPR